MTASLEVVLLFAPPEAWEPASGGGATVVGGDETDYGGDDTSYGGGGE